jgi:hypothetical protein
LLIPICDFYSTSTTSTIRWALACGKPVVDFDVFKYRYTDFLDEPAVVTVATRDEFSALMSRLAQDSDHLQRLTRQAQRAASKWGMIDGRSADRICQTFDELMAREDFAPSMSDSRQSE